MSRQRRRIVVCLPCDDARMNLPPCHFVDLDWVHGGVRTMHELAFAAAQAGWEVEVRGWFERALFDRFAQATGVRPSSPATARAPTAQDIVIVGGGLTDPMEYAVPWLSHAQLVVGTFSPLGLFGWPFISGWKRRPALEISPQDVNLAASFAALAAMDIVTWSNSEPATARAQAAGIRCSYIGEGRPTPYPPPALERSDDVVWLSNNRWAPLAQPLSRQLAASSAHIGVVSNEEMLTRLGRARVLLYPGGVEGEPRITREARAMGAVPVVVSGANPCSSRLTEAQGVLAAKDLDEMPSVADALLADPLRWSRLSKTAMQTARAEADWPTFVARIGAALADLPDIGPAQPARGEMGDRLRDRLGELTVGLAEARQTILELRAELDRRHERNVELEAELERVRSRKDAAEAELEPSRARIRSRRPRRGRQTR